MHVAKLNLFPITLRYGEVSDYPFLKPPNSIYDTAAQIGHFTQVGCKAKLSQTARFADFVARQAQAVPCLRQK